MDWGTILRVIVLTVFVPDLDLDDDPTLHDQVRLRRAMQRRQIALEKEEEEGEQDDF